MARSHPDLLEWLHEQQDFDTAMTGSLRTIRPPAEGRTEIPAHGRIDLRQSRFRRRARVLTLSALVALVLTGWWWLAAIVEQVLPPRPFTLAGDGEHLSVHHKAMEFYSEDLTELQRWLKERNNSVPAGLPGRLEELRGYGSRGSLSRDAFLKCVSTLSKPRPTTATEKKSEWLHLFIFPDRFATLRDVRTEPQSIGGSQWVFVVWREGDTSFAVGLPNRTGAPRPAPATGA